MRYDHDACLTCLFFASAFLKIYTFGEAYRDLKIESFN